MAKINKGRRNDADAAGAWLGGNRGTVQSSGAGTSDRYGSGFFSVPKNPIDAAREIGRGFMDQVDYYNRAYVNPVINVAGAVVNKVGGKSDRFKPLPQLSNKEIAIESALTVAAPLAGKAAQVAGRTVSKAYKAAKATAVPSQTVLYHGGPLELKGGVIDPSFVRGDVTSTRMAGNTALLNQQSLNLIPQHISQYKNNMNFLKDRLTDPASYSAQNRAQAMADIKKIQDRISHLESWGAKAQQGNYFTAVPSADRTYAHEGAIHVISPKTKNTTTLLGPGYEYQVVDKQKPIASFATGGRPGEQWDAAMKLAQQTGDQLKKKLQRRAVVKQTAKNLIPKRK